jgi:two-component system chemotaxis response regulator CheY
MPPQFHFLVVDDLPTVRRIVITLLKGLGHTQISEAEDGEDALKLLLSNDALGVPINFVVTDWNMPIMDGLALLQTIRATANLQHLPVLMVTAEAEASNILTATLAGADGYIVKPFLNAGTLKKILEKILIEKGLAV